MSVWWSSLALPPSPIPLFWYFHFCYFPNQNCMWFRGFLHNLERNLKKKINFLKFLYVQLVKFSSTWIPVPRPPILIFSFLLLSQSKLHVIQRFPTQFGKKPKKKKLISWNFSMSNWWSSLVLESPSPVPLFWYFHFCYYPNENCVWFRGFLHNLERNHKKKIMFLKFLYVRLVKFSSTPPSPYFDILILLLSQRKLCVIQRFPTQFGKKP
jgi:hypothetical protein